MFKKICLIVCTAVLICCTSSCSGKAYTMQEEVEAWNQATENTLARYNAVKDLSNQHLEEFINLYVYNEYDADLESLFSIPEKVIIEEEGQIKENFLHQVKRRAYIDGYDSYYYTFASANKIDKDDLATELRAFYEKYGNLQDKEVVEGDKDLSSFLFHGVTIKEHMFFTALHSPSVTEIWILEGRSGSSITVRAIWTNNQIVSVNRSV